MKKCLLWFCILLLFASCAKEEHEDYCDAHVYGHVVETYYTEEIIFSTRPVVDAAIFYDGEIIAMSNHKGEYDICLWHEGYYGFIAEKSGYFSESRSRYINNRRNKIDFWLERLDEPHHGWGAFPAITNGPVLEITAEGLSLYSRSGHEIYATKTVTLPNNGLYKFKANMLKDVATAEIYFGIQPQIKDSEWLYQTWNLNGWRPGLIEKRIYDTTIIDSHYVEGVGFLYEYPAHVDVVLKIGVNSGDLPAGHFNNIIIVKE